MAPLNIRRLSTAQAQFAGQLRRLCAYESALDESADQTAAEILAAVRAEGDAALLRYTERFDNVRATSVAQLEITPAQRARALEGLEPNTRAALEGAAARISAFHAHQREESWRYSEADGTELGQRITPLDRVGFYVPGGKAAYPSSVLMSMIPAKVAGVRELIMTVPTPDGVRNALVLAAAELAGVDRVFAIGGAQAIGALAYGTQSVPQVDKIVGPGNRYVAAAKRRVFGIVGIDMIAGPSEILIISDGKLSADWIAADLFSQAEHDELAQAILLCPEQAFIEEVAQRMQQQFERLPRQEIVRASVENRGALIHVRDLDEACAIANEIAPEHLELALAEPQRWLEKIRHAGAIFLGSHTSEALGDYCAGPSHVLPTARSARFSSPLGVYDFLKRTSIIRVSPAGARTLGQIAVTLAEGEGLHAHAQSARYRL